MNVFLWCQYFVSYCFAVFLLSHEQTKQQYFVNPPCRPSKEPISFKYRIAAICVLCTSQFSGFFQYFHIILLGLRNVKLKLKRFHPCRVIV